MDIKKVRDLTVVNIDQNKVMIVACDSAGSIGLKEADEFKVPPFYTGRFTARVALMEVLATGADVVTVTDALSVEMNPTGIEIIKGVKSALSNLSIDDENILTGSTEENFKTNSTGIGITVIGICEKSNLKINNINEDVDILCIGVPKVGDEIDIFNDKEIISLKHFKELTKIEGVLEIVPCGSKGILYELEEICKNNHLQYFLNYKMGVNIQKSCGPATCVVVAVRKNATRTILGKFENTALIASAVKRK